MARQGEDNCIVLAMTQEENNVVCIAQRHPFQTTDGGEPIIHPQAIEDEAGPAYKFFDIVSMVRHDGTSFWYSLKDKKAMNIDNKFSLVTYSMKDSAASAESDHKQLVFLVYKFPRPPLSGF